MADEFRKLFQFLRSIERKEEVGFDDGEISFKDIFFLEMARLKEKEG